MVARTRERRKRARLREPAAFALQVHRDEPTGHKRHDATDDRGTPAGDNPAARDDAEDDDAGHAPEDHNHPAHLIRALLGPGSNVRP